MSGIERLRNLAGAWDEWGLGGALAEIAEQIERELRDERDRWESDLYEAQVAWNRVMGVCLEMERHILGHEGMGDSPVARWARELRHALRSDASDSADAQNPSWHDPDGAADVTSGAAKVTRDPAEDVSMSAYDLLPQDERDAIAWVREHGGLDVVRRRWGRLSYYADPVPRAWAERRIASRQRQIDESHAALRRRNALIAKLETERDELRRQRSEAVSAQLASDAALYDLRRELRDLCEENGVEPGEDPLRAMGRHVENLTAVVENLRLLLNARAMPEGMEWPRFEDGELVDFGGEVARDDGDPAHVDKIVFYGDQWRLYDRYGVEINEDMMGPGERVKRPAPKDSWQRLEEDARLLPSDYRDRRGIADVYATEADDARAMARDIVRRAKALAERDAE